MYYILYRIISIISDDIDSFQNGVDTICNACTTYGSTPTSKTPNAIVSSIETIYNNRYNSGYNAGTAASGQKYYIVAQCSISLSAKTSANNSQSVTLYLDGVIVGSSSTKSSWGTTSRATIDAGPGTSYPLTIGGTHTIKVVGKSSGHDENATANNTTSIIINGRTVKTATASGSWGTSSATATYSLIPE